MNFRLLVSLLLVFASFNLQAQDFSNKGKDFWLAYPAHIDGQTSRMALYISATVNTSGVVTLSGGATIPFTVNANQATVVPISPSTYTVINPQTEGTNIGRGIHITSLAPVVVYAHILNQARSGSTLVLPTNTLGREYIAASYKSSTNSTPPPGTSNGSNAGSQFTIVAVEDNTIVEITPTAPDAGGVRFPNVPFTVTLNRGDVYQYRTIWSNDITGTKIRTVSNSTSSCKPIAVFCGSAWAAIDCPNASGGDNLFLQLMPKSAWGKNYVTAPFADHQYDIFRVIVADPTTVVTLNGMVLNSSALQSGTYYQFNSSGPNVITADKPIMVIQYMTSQTCDTRNAGNTTASAPFPSDPEMIIINPIEQTLNDVTVVSARNNLIPPNTNISKHFFTIIMKSNATSSLRIDGGIPAGTFIPIGSSGYSYLQENVTTSTNSNPSHRITADSGFIALAYGMGAVESYGYNAGTSIIDLYQYITLQNPQASVNFPATCVGTPFKFSITLPYQAVKIKWDFNKPSSMSPNDSVVITPAAGNSTITADSSFIRDGKTLYVYKLSINHQFSVAGTYPIKVYVTNPTPDGCSGEQEIGYDVTVYPKPVTDWSVTATGCLSDAAQFNDASNPGGRTFTSWQWDFGDATNAQVKTPSPKTYSTSGVYNIKLTTITDIGCVSDTSKPFTITTPPVAKFGVDSPRCVGSTITFSDSSSIPTGTISKWYWDFGNGNTLTNTSNVPATQSYTTAGSYTVKLQVEGNTGCKSSIFPLTIVVSDTPQVQFDMPAIVCLPNGNAQFTNQSTIVDGTQNRFTYAWQFGDGGTSVVKDPIHQYTAAGPFNVTLQVTSNAGCKKQLTKIFDNVYAQPKANFTVPAEVCFRDTTVFVNTSSATSQTITQWNWNFGDGQTSNAPDPKHRYQVADTFNVQLYTISDKGCHSDTVIKQTIVNPLPTAQFIVSSPVCETKAVTFTDQSQANVGTLTNWYWSFDDGNTGTSGGTFTHTFATAKTYNLLLAVQNSKGCKSDTLPKTITVHAQPKANYILPEVCLNDSYAQFVDSSYISDGTDSSFTYLWGFGDPNANASRPNSSTLKNPTHQYTALGSYTAWVKVTSTNGCTDSIAKTFVVNGSFPVADAVVQNATGLCSNKTVSIQNKSTVSPGDITKLEIYWDFANDPTIKDVDQTPTFDKIYSHKYPDFQQPLTKTFQVRVVAYSGASCTGIKDLTITVNASPKTAFITIPGICLDAAPRQITQASELGGVPKAQDVFSGNTAGISSAGLFDPATAGVGTYTLQYLYISPAGCRDSSTNSITVWPSPTANFNVSNALCEKSAVTFTDNSTANFSNIKFWDWNFGDGNTSTKTSSTPFSHTYATAGTYNATLKVTTDSGCVSTVTPKQLIINSLPKVDFSLPSICLPDGRGTFNDLSTLNGSTGVFSYLWNFGDANDPNPSTQQNPTHKYSALGPYQVKLRVITQDGCIDSTTKNLTTVYRQPKADFSITPASAQVCLGDPFSFSDNSTGLDGAVTQWNWNFGDGSAVVTFQNAGKTYTKDSIYKVSLFIYNDKGCVSDTMVKDVTVHAYPLVNAGADVFVLEGGYLVLNPTVTGSGLSYQWAPNSTGYLDNPNIKNPRFTPGNDQLYTLTVTGDGGCVSTDDLFVKVLRAPMVPNAFSPNGDGINDTWVIEYLDSYPGCTIEVYDRYGKRVFFSEGYKTAWNGTSNGKPLPVGVYYYIINPKNGRQLMSGSLTILR
jgi:gliding motility-associated-like protein